ncbi:MAG TPA: ABC transporter ATP-binding protein [Ardenticatenaceae bacterium]|nr:ABC transporter ATP-binding protein [Ardenticatenaceae bacterium]
MMYTADGSNGEQGPQGSTATGFIRLERLTKSYTEGGREHPITRELSIEFNQGEFIALLGRSGSGKSTLLNLISGIDVPTSGDVFIGDVRLTGLSERERTLFRRKHIGFVFQFFNLIPTLSVLENVALPLELLGRPTREAHATALAFLERVGLTDRAGASPDRLSGGEQQRVAIARASVHSPALLLADEPTGNLDEEIGRQVLALLLELSREAGKTLIMATHSREVASRADRIFRIVEGNLVPETRPTVPHASVR